MLLELAVLKSGSPEESTEGDNTIGSAGTAHGKSTLPELAALEGSGPEGSAEGDDAMGNAGTAQARPAALHDESNDAGGGSMLLELAVLKSSGPREGTGGDDTIESAGTAHGGSGDATTEGATALMAVALDTSKGPMACISLLVAPVLNGSPASLACAPCTTENRAKFLQLLVHKGLVVHKGPVPTSNSSSCPVGDGTLASMTHFDCSWYSSGCSALCGVCPA